MTLDLTKPLQLEDGTPVKYVHSGRPRMYGAGLRHLMVIKPGSDAEMVAWATDDGASAAGQIVNVPERKERYYYVDLAGAISSGASFRCNCNNLKLIYEDGKLVASEVLK